jgi:hypothetical protein
VRFTKFESADFDMLPVLKKKDDLEGRLNSETSTSDEGPTPDRSSGPGLELIWTGRYEQLPPQDVIEEL